MDSTGNTYCYEPRRSSTFSLPPPPRQHNNPDSDQVLSPPLTPSITPSITTLSANHHFKSKFPSDHPLAYQTSSAIHPASSSPNRLVVDNPIDRRSSACSAMSLDEFNRQYWDTNRMVKENRSFSFSDRMPSRRQPSKQNKHVCNYPHCGWSFKRYEHLKRHMLVHTGERPHACPYPGCGKRFSRSDNFHAHYRTHTKKALEQQKGTSTTPGANVNVPAPPPTSSSDTGAPPAQTFLPPPPSFDSFHHPHHHPHHRMDQQQHQDTHHYLMNRSNATTSQALQAPAFHHHHHHHRQSFGPMEGAAAQPPPNSSDNMMPPPSSSPSSSSDDEKQHICTHPDCHRRFKRLEHLKRHMRIHTLERPFQCTYAGCQKSFSRSDNLTQHLKTHERRESRYQEHRPYPSPYHNQQQQQRPQTPNESMSFVDFMRPGHHPTSSSQHHPAPAPPNSSTSSSMQHMLSWHPGDAAGSVGC